MGLTTEATGTRMHSCYIQAEEKKFLLRNVRVVHDRHWTRYSKRHKGFNNERSRICVPCVFFSPVTCVLQFPILFLMCTMNAFFCQLLVLLFLRVHVVVVVVRSLFYTTLFYYFTILPRLLNFSWVARTSRVVPFYIQMYLETRHEHHVAWFFAYFTLTCSFIQCHHMWWWYDNDFRFVTLTFTGKISVC